MHRSHISKLITCHCSNVAGPDPGGVDVSPAARTALALLRTYKVLISPLFAGSCRYHPSCADYMSEAVRMHGAVRGIWLGLRRLGRCHPFGGHGLDPVPRP